MIWREAVKEALRRIIVRRPNRIITLAELRQTQLRQIVRDTGSRGKTPERTLERVCQELRDAGILDFIDNNGTYRVTGALVGKRR